MFAVTYTWCFLLMLLGSSQSVSNRRCLPLEEGGSYCFTQPDPPLALSWSAAQQWCQSIDATLPITDNDYHSRVFRNAIGYFGLQTETIWLGANFTYDPDNWFWTDGSRFTEEIEGNSSIEMTSAYVMRNGTQLKFVAASPLDNNGYICRSSDSEINCASSFSTLWVNGHCYKKRESCSSRVWYTNCYLWYSYQSYYCSLSDMPAYDDLKEFARWLDISRTYWIPVRCGWWTWQDLATGRSFEMTAKKWDSSASLPNSADGQCMSSSESVYSASNCSRSLQFVCQEHLKATGLPSGLAIGLGVAFGVLLLAVIIWIAVLAVRARRRKRASNYSPLDPIKQSEYNHPRRTSINAYDNYTFNVGSKTLDRNGKAYMYKPINRAANESVY